MSVILFIVILLVLIVAHEYGHFIVAKKSGIRVDEFGIGFPPKAFTYMRKDGTDYTINWLPFGGFVKIFGENPTEEALSGPDSHRSFVNKPKIIQAMVLVAGVVFNFILAWILLSSIFMIGTDIAITEEERESATNIRLVIADVLPESPAYELGLIPGDTITFMSAGDEVVSVYTPENVSAFISTHADSNFILHIVRGDEDIDISLNTASGLIAEEPDRKIMGITMGLAGFIQYKNPLKALYEGGKLTFDMTRLVWSGLVSFFAGIFTFNADFSAIAGPVGIVGVVGEAAGIGLTSVLFLTALISINLAIINILPIPALDGGRLLFLAIESIKGSPINPKLSNSIHGLFFGLLILLILVITFFDISKLFA